MIHSVEGRTKKGGARSSISAAIKYLLREKDSKNDVREDILILAGDPGMLMTAEAGLPSKIKSRFLHTSLAFTEAETDMLDKQPEKLDAIIDSYKRQLAAGLPDPDRLTTLAVQHREKGKMHVHFLTLRADIETGMSYQPFVKQRGDIHRFNAWNNLMQSEFGLENPNGIEHKKAFSIDRHAPNAGIKTELGQYIQEQIEAGRASDRAGIIAALKAVEGVTVSRTTPSAISIKIEGRKQAVRLTGGIFHESFSIDRESEIKSKQPTSESIQELREDIQSRMQAVNREYGRRFRVKDREREPLDNVRGMRLIGNSSEHNNDGNPKISAIDALPKHKIFRDCTIEKNQIIWRGDYGSALITLEPHGGITCGRGSKMEWRMAAQIAKQEGWPSVGIECPTEAQAKIAYKEARAAGYDHKDINIRIGGINYETAELDSATFDESAIRRTASVPETSDAYSEPTRNRYREANTRVQAIGRDIEWSVNGHGERLRNFKHGFQDLVSASHGINQIATSTKDIIAIRANKKQADMRVKQEAARKDMEEHREMQKRFKDGLKLIKEWHAEIPMTSTTRETASALNKLSKLRDEQINDTALRELLKTHKTITASVQTLKDGRSDMQKYLDGEMTASELGNKIAAEKPETQWQSESRHTGMHM